MTTGIGNVIVGGSTIKGGIEESNGSQLAQGAPLPLIKQQIHLLQRQ